MEDLLEALQLQQLGHGDAAVFADDAEVVALEVGDHHQLGDFLWRSEEVVGRLFVRRRFRAPRAGAFDRAGADRSSAHFQEGLRRGGKDRASIQLDECRARSGRVVAQGFVECPRISAPRRGEAVREIYLIDVPLRDVILSPRDHGAELLALDRRGEHRPLRSDRRTCPPDLDPSAHRMPRFIDMSEDERVVVEAEAERALVFHESRREAVRQAVVEPRLRGLRPHLFAQLRPFALSAPAQNPRGPGRDDREMLRAAALQRCVEKNHAR